MLAIDSSIQIVGEAATVAEAVTELDAQCPDVVLLDMRLPDGNGARVCPELQLKYPDSRLVILTSHPDESSAVEAIIRGAAGYLTKNITRHDLIEAVKLVAHGHTVLAPSITRRIVQRIQRGTLGKTAPALSTQQRRILELVVNGLTNKEIGEELGLSEKTVRNYLYRLYKKWRVKGRSHAASVFLQRTAIRQIQP